MHTQALSAIKTYQDAVQSAMTKAVAAQQSNVTSFASSQKDVFQKPAAFNMADFAEQAKGFMLQSFEVQKTLVEDNIAATNVYLQETAAVTKTAMKDAGLASVVTAMDAANDQVEDVKAKVTSAFKSAPAKKVVKKA